MLVSLSLLLAGCGGPAAGAKPTGGPVDVLYAGSLVDVMQNEIAPAFQKATGYHLVGFAGGSQALANEITGKLLRADVFISAAPSINDALMGKKNGDFVSWYATFAQAPLVIGYNPKSAFASALKTQPWYVVMQERGFRLGRTDPKLDPKGALTIAAVNAAQAYYNLPGLAQRILGTTENPNQVFPEQALVGRLQSGQLDAGFFYENEAVQANIPIIRLAPALKAAATFTLATVRGGLHPAAAAAFIRFLLSPQGEAILHRSGLEMTTPQLTGRRSAVPSSLRALVAP